MIETFLHECYSWIYRLPTEDLPECAVFAAMLYVTLYRKYAGKRWLRPGIGGVLAVWFLAVLWTTILDREPGSYESSWIPLHTYWKIFSGGHPELERSGLMNVLLFYPGGLLLAGLLPRHGSYRRRMICAVICFGLFSLSIELSQYFFQLGTAEIDDVLHNTLGAAAGFAAFHLDLDDPQR
jgi:VanZ family protein